MCPTENPFLNDPFASRLGIELLDAAPGRARAKLTVDERLFNGAGSLHGGAIYTLAVWTMAVAANQGRDDLSVGINGSISYVRAVSEGEIIAEARQVAAGRRIGTYAVDIIDSEGRAIAAFQGQTCTKKR